MTGVKPKIFKPNPAAHRVYGRLFALYRKLHDAFGMTAETGNLHEVMKHLIDIRNAARK